MLGRNRITSVGVFVPAGLYVSRPGGDLVFRTLVERVIVVVSCFVFMLALGSKRFTADNYPAFLVLPIYL